VVARVLQGARGVFHLAEIPSVAQSAQGWEAAHHANVQGLVNVLAGCARLPKPIPVVYASSAAVYGQQADAPLSEDDKILPNTPYGADKLSGEIQARIASLTYGVPTIGLRMFHVYGEKQRDDVENSGVVALFLRALRSGKPINFYGDGQQTRDFVYVSDAVKALCAAMTQCENHAVLFDVVNVCTGVDVSLEELAGVMEKITGKSVVKQYQAARAGDVGHLRGNPDKMMKILGISADKSLYEGLKLMCEGKRDAKIRGAA
jgi:UDP-glucose 4-epimerase